MYSSELVIWSLMVGGLLTLISAAVGDVLITRSSVTLRGLVFLVLTGTSFVMLSGLPEDLFPQFPERARLILEASLAPLGGALTLTYLGQWLGVAAEDRWVHYTVVWGAVALIVASVVVAIMAAMQPYAPALTILTLAAMVNCGSVLMSTFASLRAARLGDTLARWVLLACLFLAIALFGLFSHRFNQDDSSVASMMVTAFCSVAFFQVMVALGLHHNRQQRRLEKLSKLDLGADPATGLPRGSVLLSKVDDAFWRSARLGANSTVVCIHLRNLYELGEVAGHNIDQQILSALSARIRRAVGFRCVVGLYHPRCFVVVISAIKQPKVVERMVQRLHLLMDKPLSILDLQDVPRSFQPQISFGSVTVVSDKAVAAEVIDRAERLALAAGHVGETVPVPLDELEPQSAPLVNDSAPTVAAPLGNA